MAAKESQLEDTRGARPSNAGDQFHELWALQQTLNLLIPGSPLTAVTVEGVASENAENSDNAFWDGVDCALYHGGETLESAQYVDIAQLKFSSANPGQNWTIARLTKNDSKKGDNSVFRRLADAFAEARRRMSPSAKLTVRLVSNQPISNDVTECLGADWSGSLEHSDELALSLRGSLVKIKASTGLDDESFRTFIGLLDLSECGVGSRFSLKNSIVQFTAQMVAEDVGASAREMMYQVRELMMPGRARDVITREMVLGWFEITTEAALFPAPSAFKELVDPIIREPAKALYRTIDAGSRITCVHGEAGCGKTTTVLQLRQLLPPGSVMIAFDCYGAGRYLRSTDRRHLPEHAFTQILNEVALSAGIPFVMPRRSQKPVLTKFFFERIQVAAQLVKQANPNALLVVALDAADNSVTAANQADPAEPCFVTELANAAIEDIPENVRFVFSARSARQHTLRLPAGAVDIPCPPFTPPETKEFVTKSLPSVDDTWLIDFQALSKGVPRVQDYALRGGQGHHPRQNRIGHFLPPSVRTLA